jgi:hypothetical protein
VPLLCGCLFGSQENLLFEIGRTPFRPFAFFTFGYILDFAVLENSLHSNFAAAGAEKLLRRGACP